MKIDNIKIRTDGYVLCKSAFYSSVDVIQDSTYTFSAGINRLSGEIDSGNWGLSYLLSMYKCRPKDFVIYGEPDITVNDMPITLGELSKLSCYMDKIYPLFPSNASLKKSIIRGLKHSQLKYTCSDVLELFRIDDYLFERRLYGFGNAIFRAMAAIGFSYGKEIFCFPWLSSMRFEHYHNNMIVLLEILESLGKVVISPVGEVHKVLDTPQF